MVREQVGLSIVYFEMCLLLLCCCVRGRGCLCVGLFAVYNLVCWVGVIVSGKGVSGGGRCCHSRLYLYSASLLASLCSAPGCDALCPTVLLIIPPVGVWCCRTEPLWFGVDCWLSGSLTGGRHRCLCLVWARAASVLPVSALCTVIPVTLGVWLP